MFYIRKSLRCVVARSTKSSGIELNVFLKYWYKYNSAVEGERQRARATGGCAYALQAYFVTVARPRHRPRPQAGCVTNRPKSKAQCYKNTLFSRGRHT